MRRMHWIPLLLVVVLAACAQQPTRTASALHSTGAIDYSRYVQNDVGWMPFHTVSSWDSNDTGSVVVWTMPNRAYLLTLVGPCIGLRSAVAIGLTSHAGSVSSARDAVIVRGERCPIMRIQQLDAKAIEEARHPSRASSGAKD